MATTTTTTTAGSPPTVTAVDVCPSLPLHDLTNARDCALRASSESKWAISGATEDKSAVRAVDQAGMIETTPTLMITAQEEEVQLPTPPLSASPSSTPPEGRWCRRCGATETGRWRTGPLGKGTLCNACGLNWKNKNYPTEGYNNSTYPPPPIEKKARSSAPCRQTKRTNVNSKEKQAHRARRPKSRRKTEDEETYSQAAACSLPSPPSQNDPLLPDNNHGVSEIPQDTRYAVKEMRSSCPS
ncbi:hypothetical protein BX666DRAFT_297731 [Dichotomocladium elegans]|nr:hypothetical protein BX666DRAFT_297731 [Dichotomocladium elegans]